MTTKIDHQSNWTSELNRAASDAVKVISDAASRATTTIADAALNATRLLASNASDAAKIVEAKEVGDHDNIVKLLVGMEDIKIKIKELSDGTATRISNLESEKLNIRDSYPVLYKQTVEERFKDHEDRIRINTERITKIMTFGTALVIGVGILEFIISNFIK